MNDGFFLLDRDLQFVVWNAGCELRAACGRPVKCSGKTWSPTLLGYAGELGQSLPDGELPLQTGLGQPADADGGRAHPPRRRVVGGTGRASDSAARRAGQLLGVVPNCSRTRTTPRRCRQTIAS